MKKIINLTVCISAILLAACSDNPSEKQHSLNTGIEKKLSSSSENYDGVWGFCNDKKADVSLAEDSCQTIDASVWHMANGELTVLEVNNTETEGCTTACFKLNNESLNTKAIATGSYTFDENGYSFTITDSSDEKKFPICTVNWDFGNKLADDLIEWKFNNVDCELPEMNYTAWARKYKGQVN